MSWRVIGRRPVVGLVSWICVSLASAAFGQVITYVSPSGSHTSPYSSWETAARDIQAAINATPVGGLVLVTNGVYNTGGVKGYPSGSLLTNRVAIHKAVTVQSVNGPDVTVIEGRGPQGDAAIRCVYMTNGALLVGFTLRNGATRAPYVSMEDMGGGVWAESSGAVVSNCIVTGNSAHVSGGGAYNGTMYNCTLTGNSASYYGGGILFGTLYNCTLVGNSVGYYGGGARGSTLYNCTLSGNRAGNNGGGAYDGTLNNCTLAGNSAGYYGGGANGSTLYNCTLFSNSAYYGGGAYNGTLYNCTLAGNAATNYGGGAYYGTQYNCIVYYNQAPNGPNYYSSSFDHSCATPLPSGSGNIASDPRIVSVGKPRLLPDSPCINAGTNQTWMAEAVDMAGRARIKDGVVDMGAYEYQANTQTGSLSVAIGVNYTNVAVGFAPTFTAQIQGEYSGFVWRWGDGGETPNSAIAGHAYTAPGTYEAVLCASNLTMSAAATVTVQVVEDIRYVSPSGTHEAPFASWATAATDIQSAIDAATIAGGLVLVTNGVYNTGGLAGYPSGSLLTNRVVLYKPVIVRSVNGPDMTVIEGAGPMGDSAIRCAYVANGASLVGFTLRNGATRVTGYGNRDGFGGALLAESVDVVVSNCTVVNNMASVDGGGVYAGTLHNCALLSNSASNSGGGAFFAMLYNCTLSGNSAGAGGGTYNGTLYNCVLSGNSARYGGGANVGKLYNCVLCDNAATYAGGGTYNATVYNSITYYNRAPDGPNYLLGSMDHTCTMPLPTGSGNITNEPRIVAFNNPRLLPGSPCINAGTNQTWMEEATDMAGRPRIVDDVVDIGAYEYQANTQAGSLSAAIAVDYTNVAVGFAPTFTAHIEGECLGLVWRWGDGGETPDSATASHAYGTVGAYDVVLWASNLTMSAAVTITVQVVEGIHYVSASGTHEAPFVSWEAAATDIQAAIDAAAAGALVLVTNGVYNTGGKAGYPTGSLLTNRIALYKPVTVRSVNGPDVTVIEGAGPMGDAAIRCAYVTDGALLIGFTLRNGVTRLAYDDDGSGGGIWAERARVVVSNCIIAANSAKKIGGGAFNGAFYNCTLTGNSAQYGGGVSYATLYNCGLSSNSASAYGGGAYFGTLYNCLLTGNSASSYGGGASFSTLNNCTLTGNSSLYDGGGTANGTLYNCLLTGNLASHGGGGASHSTLYNCTLTGNSSLYYGGGTYYGTLYNCIVYYNRAPDGSNYSGGSFDHGCTTPLPSGSGNITNEPGFVSAGDLRLLPDSPCINAGTNQAWMAEATDLAGASRVLDDVVDIGAYEFIASAPLMAVVTVDHTNVAAGYASTFAAHIRGECLGFVWDWGDGAQTSDTTPASHAYAALGTYEVVLRASNLTLSAAATVTVQVVESIHYVSPDGAHEAPFISWETAATNIQSAIDVAVAGGLVLVTNGVYNTGGVAGYPAGSLLTNRVAIHKPLTVQSVNGPDVTVIEGQGPKGSAAIRCVYLANRASLAGFTLRNGATRDSWDAEGDGGGVLSEGAGAVVSNCVVTGNSALYHGGGACGGTFYNCTLAGNSAFMGGGAYEASLLNCTLRSNVVQYAGGGAGGGALYNCTLLGNRVLIGYGHGGGAYYSTLYNCTLTGNSSAYDGGGAYNSTLYNCIVYYNEAPYGPNYNGGTFDHVCTTPLPSGPGNIADEPGFSSLDNPRLFFDSPCINAGTNQSWMTNATDLAGLSRISDGVVDIGAYELQVGEVGERPRSVYVSANGSHTYPYTNWATAARDIQAAINVVADDGLVWVTNGVYNTGGAARYPSGSLLTNRVAIHKPVTVRSINGPRVTVIEGRGPVGNGAIRCAYVTNGASLIGFTLRNGSTRAYDRPAGERNGGGVWVDGPNAIVSDCILAGNWAGWDGGGAYNGTLYNCAIFSNSAANFGGGVYGSTLYNCTLTGNSSYDGGGTWGATQYNCIVYYNQASRGPNYDGGSFDHSCTTPLPAGSGNMTNEPLLVGISDPELLSSSPCINAGTNQAWMIDAADLAGRSRIVDGMVDIGAFEYDVSVRTGMLSVVIGAVSTNVFLQEPAAFSAHIQGECLGFVWDWGDGDQTPNIAAASHTYAVTGSYEIILRASNLTMSVATTATVQVARDIRYVSPSGSHTFPYSSWQTAARDIQTAINAVHVGGLVLVTNGVYNTGGVAGYPYGPSSLLPNRIAINKRVTVQSVNGPDVTVIEGQGPVGNGAIRCVYMVNGASLAGFTLRNGATRGGPGTLDGDCGGLRAEGPGAVASNCVITGNSAYYSGGGVYYGTLYNCTLSGNSAENAGGAYYSTLYNCTLTSNSARHSSGGAYYGTLYNCTLTGNSAGYGSGGAYGGTLHNCTLTGNAAGNYGGGADWCTLFNCIVYYNQASRDPNSARCSFDHSCTTPLPSGSGNIADEPGIVNIGKPRLLPTSLCINAGTNQSWMSDSGDPRSRDVEGHSRILDGVVDMGAYEYEANTQTGALSVTVSANFTLTAVGVAPVFTANIQGECLGFVWHWGDGGETPDRWVASHAYANTGTYEVVLWASNLTMSSTATVTVQVVLGDVRYVSPGGSNTFPYLSWETAARDIQAAVDVAPVGGLVLVTNGVYNTGGGPNRVTIQKSITLQSVNGPEVTVIEGQGPAGPAAIRCVHMGNGASLVGFTLRNGCAYPDNGGGVWASPDAVVSNCIISGNSYGGVYGGTLYNCIISGNSYYGGVCGGTLYNCTLTGNSAYEGGGAKDSTLDSCTLTGNSASSYGGGACNSTLYKCVLSGNWASIYGGGAYSSTLYKCALSGNQAGSVGGGAYNVTLYNCTLSGNSARSGGGAMDCALYNCTLTGNWTTDRYYGLGGGSYHCRLYNCIVYYNSSRNAPNQYNSYVVYNSCTTPAAPGSGNITNEPKIVSIENPRLHPNSPCINSGINQAWMTGATDLADQSRIHGGVVDMGAYEYHPNTQTGALSVAISVSSTNAVVGFGLAFTAYVQGDYSGFVWRWGDGGQTPDSFETSHTYAAPGVYEVVLCASNLTMSPSATVTVWVVNGLSVYVSPGGSHTFPYTNWATAATNIQAAIDAAPVGALVLVTNGVYNTGGVVGYPSGSLLTNRIAIDKFVTVRSVNGPNVTVIEGQGPMGDAAVRCAYITNGASLIGFTLTKGATRSSGHDVKDRSGGGIWAEGSGAVVSKCVVTGNSAAYDGGGAYNGTLYNCALTGNSAGNSGGGVYNGTLYNCTLSDNSANSGGGVYGGIHNNCIAYYNEAPIGPNYFNVGGFDHGCTWPLLPGSGNITNDPWFVLIDNPRLLPNSPCINAGLNQSWMSDSRDPRSCDPDGNPRIMDGVVDMGAYEYAGRLQCDLSAAPRKGSAPLAVVFDAYVSGDDTTQLHYRWDFQNDGVWDLQGEGLKCVTNVYGADGRYTVSLAVSNASGAAAITKSNYVEVGSAYIAFERYYYSSESNIAVVTLRAVEANHSPVVADTVDVRAFSASDAQGIRVTLTETAADSGVFATEAAGRNLRLSLGASSAAEAVLRVSDGDHVSLVCTSAIPGRELTDTAIFDDSPPVTTFSTVGEHTYSLCAYDQHSPVVVTEYGINGSPLSVFTGPFTFDLEGTYLVAYRSQDQAGNWEALKTTTVDLAPPAAPSGFAVLQVGLEAQLSWLPNAEPDVYGYNVYRDGARLNSDTLFVPDYKEPITSGKTYTYNVTAVDRSGNESPFSVSVQITTVGMAPVILQPTNGTIFVDSVIQVAGTAEPGSTVEVFVNGLSKGAAVASGQQKFSVSGVQLSDGTNTLTAIATSLYGMASPLSATVTVLLDSRPQPPAALNAVAGDIAVLISWAGSVEPDVRGYNIYRDGERLNAALLDGTSFTDVRLTNGKTYTYAVTAVDARGESTQSATVAATPVAGPEWGSPP
ncbi:MAG: choice-of-anchor Q domain-containing protein [bacterium]